MSLVCSRARLIGAADLIGLQLNCAPTHEIDYAIEHMGVDDANTRRALGNTQQRAGHK
jgi:hypothetical protein